MTSRSRLCSSREHIHCRHPNTTYPIDKWLVDRNRNCLRFHSPNMADPRIVEFHPGRSRARPPFGQAGWTSKTELEIYGPKGITLVYSLQALQRRIVNVIKSRRFRSIFSRGRMSIISSSGGPWGTHYEIVHLRAPACGGGGVVCGKEI